MVISFFVCPDIYLYRDIANQKRSNNTCWQEALEEKHVEIPAEAGLGHVEVNVYVCPPAGAREPTSRAGILRGCFFPLDNCTWTGNKGIGSSLAYCSASGRSLFSL